MYTKIQLIQCRKTRRQIGDALLCMPPITKVAEQCAVSLPTSCTMYRNSSLSCYPPRLSSHYWISGLVTNLFRKGSELFMVIVRSSWVIPDEHTGFWVPPSCSMLGIWLRRASSCKDKQSCVLLNSTETGQPYSQRADIRTISDLAVQHLWRVLAHSWQRNLLERFPFNQPGIQ